MLGYAHDGGIKKLAAASPKLAFFLGADEVDYSLFSNTFKVYVGHHGDNGAHHADVILPGAAYSEKSGTYVNLEGRVQRGERAVFPPGDAREDWAIFRALSDALGKRLPFDSVDALRAEMAKAVPAPTKAPMMPPPTAAEATAPTATAMIGMATGIQPILQAMLHSVIAAMARPRCPTKAARPASTITPRRGGSPARTISPGRA
jgi:NADH dehydrogenase/NADH:ubiquinone oxidoreductase subunit G